MPRLDSYPTSEGWAEYTLTSQEFKIFGEIEGILIQEEDDLALSKVDLSSIKSLEFLEIWKGAHSFSTLNLRNKEHLGKVRVAYIPSLKEINLGNSPELEDLVIPGSSLSTINIPNCPKLNLNFIACFENKIKLDGMKKLVTSLPMREDSDPFRHFYITNSLADNPKDANEYDDKILKVLTGKNWIPFDWLNGKGEDDDNPEGKPLSSEILASPSSMRIFIVDGKLCVEGAVPSELLSLYDTSGKALLSSVATPEGTASFVIKELPKGVYIVTSSHRNTKVTI